MRILCEHPKDANYLIRSAWGPVLTAARHVCLFWDPASAPIADVLDEFRPDLFIGDTGCDQVVNRGVKVLYCDQPTPALDTFNFYPGEHRGEFECDVAIVQDYDENLEKLVLPLCDAASGLHVKIFGNKPWPVPQYLGSIWMQDMKDLFYTAKVSLHLGNIEREYQVMGSKGFLPLLAEGVEGIKEQVKLPAKQRILVSESDFMLVMDFDTYWHRLHALFINNGLTEEANKILETYAKTRRF